jgi:hypothetical protein
VSDRDSIEQLVLTAKFVGANANPEVIGENMMEYKCNYFLGNDSSKWHTDVPNYEAITLKDIYPGIDLRYSGDGSGQAAYEFIAAPGADIAQIKVEYEGAEATSIDADGRMIVKTKWGDMIAAIKTPTNGVLSGTGSFSQLSDNTVGFEANGSNRQALGTQSISLVYSTYLGGGSYDEGYGIAVDGSGNAYVTGETGSSDFPTLNPYQGTSQGGYTDVFVTKLSSTGNSLIYSTYLGGGGVDYGQGIAVDGSGNAYVTGSTWSSDFPTMNPYQTDQDTTDVFVTKLSSTGASLVYSTYLGGAGDDYGYGIAIDGSGNAFVTGYTSSTNFPTLNPFQATFQGGYVDAFVTKLSSSGNALIYSTYLGGTGDDYGNGIAVDGSGCAFVTGYTGSSNFPTLNPYQETFQGGYRDVFVTMLSNAGNYLIYSTYLGGGLFESGYGIAVDGSGNAYVTGYTESSDFPTLNPYQTDQGSWDAFVTKLSSSGNSLIYSTYLGGSGSDDGYGIAVDSNGNAYVAGSTWSSDFPTMNPYQGTYQGGLDAFVTKLSNSGASLFYSTYFGGVSNDVGRSIAVDGSGSAYVTGHTWSSNFPTLNPSQTYQGIADAFVTKLNDGAIVPTFDPPVLNELPTTPSPIGSFRLSWSQVAGCEGYELQWSSSSLFTPVTGSYIATSNLEISHSVNCLAEGAWYFRVRATKSGESPSAWSNVVTATVDFTQGMPFSVNPNGWSFSNWEQNVWPQTWWSRFNYFGSGSGSLYSPQGQNWFDASQVEEYYFPDWPLYAQTFPGLINCCYDNTYFKPKMVQLNKWLNFVKNRQYMWAGSCTGFAMTSLFFFDSVYIVAEKYDSSTLFSVPPYGSNPADPNFYEINKYWLNHFKSGYMGYFVDQNQKTKPSQTLQLLAGMFNNTSRQEDRYLIMDDHLGSDFSHAVIPISLEYQGCGTNLATILVYDNSADPSTQERFVTVNLNSNTWSYTSVDDKHVGGSLGLYLSEPIGVYQDSPNYKRMPNDTTAYPVEVFAPHRSNVVISLENGDSLGYVNGELILPTDLSAAVPIVPISEHRSWPIAYNLGDLPFTTTLTNTRDTAYALSIFRDSTMLTVGRGLLPSGATDDVSCRPVDRLLTLTNGSAISGNYTLEALFGAGAVELGFTIGNLDIGPADSCRLQVVNSEAIRLTNYGDSASYDLTIDATNADHGSRFTHAAIPFKGGSAHNIYANLQDDSIVSVTLYIDIDNDGIVDDTLAVNNQPAYQCGDIDLSGQVDISDAVYLINYIFGGGPAPQPAPSAADFDCTEQVDISDAVYLIAYIFSGGPTPCAGCK